MTWLAIVAAVTSACGRGGIQAATPSTTQGNTGTQQTGTPDAVPCDGSVTLVVRGVDAGNLTTFKVDLTSIELRAGGVALAPDWSAAGTTLSLAATETPELAALKRVAGPVDVTVSFGNVLICQGAGCTSIDTCTAPITFRYDVDKADANGCHVFLQLDLANSVQPIVGGEAFLPRFSVKYW